jgi:hypothetical protein
MFFKLVCELTLPLLTTLDRGHNFFLINDLHLFSSRAERLDHAQRWPVTYYDMYPNVWCKNGVVTMGIRA